MVGLLAGPGMVQRLGFGGLVLLQPERLNAYAAAVVRKVRSIPRSSAASSRKSVLAGDLDYQDIAPAGRRGAVVLRAMHQTFVDRGLCLREPTENGPLLVFPSYFRRERPELGPSDRLVTYTFNGPLDEIYATLVVRLHHTKAFEKEQLWRFAADFKTQTGNRSA